MYLREGLLKKRESGQQNSYDLYDDRDCDL